MSKTKKIVLGDQEYEIGPFVIGQVEIISPILWKMIRAMGGNGVVNADADPVALFLSLDMTPELISDLTKAIAAALPKNAEGKRPTLDEVKNMEATFLDMWVAMFSILTLCGFGAAGGAVEMGEPPAGTVVTP